MSIHETPKKLPQRLRAKQIAEMYGVGLSTVWLYSKQNKIKAIKVSERITVFDTKEVDKLFSGGIDM